MQCINSLPCSSLCLSASCSAKASSTCSNTADACYHDHLSCQFVPLAALQRVATRLNSLVSDVDEYLPAIKEIINLAAQFTQWWPAIELREAVQSVVGAGGAGGKKGTVNLTKEQKISISKGFEAFREIPTAETVKRVIAGLKATLDRTGVVYESRIKLKLQDSRSEQVGKFRENSKPAAVEAQQPLPLMSLIPTDGQQLSPNRQTRIRKSSKSKNKQLPSKLSLIAQMAVTSIIPKGPLFSKITDDVECIQTFFHTKFHGAKLLYRASQNEFSAAKFHQKCNGVRNTLVLIQTDSERTIGGFTPLPWRSGCGQWYQDSSQTSFLFSMTANERFPVVNSLKAIWCSHGYGPSFGQPDLQIADRANTNANSCANFPQVYNNGNYTAGMATTHMFVGSKNGHFRVKEWEVYEMLF